MKKILAVVIITVLLASAFLGCDTTKDPQNNQTDTGIPTEDSIIISVEDYDITFGDFNNIYNSYYEMYAAYGMLDPEDEAQLEEFKNTLVQYQLENVVPAYAAKKLGIDLSEEEQKECDDTFQAQIMSYLSQYEDVIDPSMQDEALRYDAKLALFKDDLRKDGIDYDEFVEKQKKDIYLSKLSNKMIDDAVKDVSVTDDEVKQEYDRQIEALRAEYDENILAYYSYYQDVVSGMGVYPRLTPEGYYYITYIYVPRVSEDIRDYDPEKIFKEIEEKLADVKKEKDPDKKAEAFKALVNEYGQDEVLKMEPFSADGTLFHPDMQTEYYPSFIEQAKRLEKKGDISERFSDENGLYIMMRLDTVEAGAVDFETVKDEVKEELVTELQRELYNKAMDEWKEMIDLTVKTEYLEYLGADFASDNEAEEATPKT